MSKRRLLWLVPLIVIVIAGIIIYTLWLVQHNTPTLDAEYYGNSGFTTIDSTELGEMIDAKRSFLVFVYQPDCRTSDDFEQVATEFSDTYHISMYKIAYSSLRNSFLLPELKYYPSLIVYHDGEAVNFLRADVDADLPAYKSVDDLKVWLEQYIKLTP